MSSDTNPGRNKKRGGSSNLPRKQVRSETAPPAPRASKRKRKQVVREGCATEEDLRTLDNSSPLASSRTNTTSEANNEAQQGQQSNGQAQDQVPQTSSSDLRSSAASRGSTSEQSPAELLRAAAVRQAQEDTEAAAAAETVGVKDSSRVTTSLSVTAQGKQPENPPEQAQAGSSREREMVERPNPGAEMSAPRGMGNSHIANDLRGTDLSEEERGPGMFYFNEREREALQGCEMIYETDIEHAGVWTVIRLSNTIFQLSLANVFDELRLIDSATLHLHFGRGDYKVGQFRRGQDGEKDFAAFKERCLELIKNQRRRAASASAVQGRGVKYFVKFSDGPITDAWNAW